MVENDPWYCACGTHCIINQYTEYWCDAAGIYETEKQYRIFQISHFLSLWTRRISSGYRNPSIFCQMKDYVMDPELESFRSGFWYCSVNVTQVEREVVASEVRQQLESELARNRRFQNFWPWRYKPPKSTKLEPEIYLVKPAVFKSKRKIRTFKTKSEPTFILPDITSPHPLRRTPELPHQPQGNHLGVSGKSFQAGEVLCSPPRSLLRQPPVSMYRLKEYTLFDVSFMLVKLCSSAIKDSKRSKTHNFL
jgi:hypothetical protein